ncbi:MAG: molybdopterin-dependent oxidoreductase, partial [Deltaproteobacteria bacterium]|nr:molybdopterin-dependent oxidoreductase [Deltaproteobacteria bacterium]
MKRRDFLKFIGVGGAGAGLGFLFGKVTKPPGAKLIPYLVPPEDIIPGTATWYASLCSECGAGCGTLVKVMEGRAKKIEGNPKHPVNKGKLCARGHASLQALYNPDRIKGPQKRTGERGANNFTEITWEEGISILSKKLSEIGGGAGADKLYFLTEPLKGHLGALASVFMSTYGSSNYIPYELFQRRNLAYANEASMSLGAFPHYDIENTNYLLSFGADFSTSWLSPVAYSLGYGRMRQGRGERGRLVQVEPRMSLTGANADEWIAPRPGTEGILALSIAYAMVEKGYARAGDASSWRTALAKFRPKEVSAASDVDEERIYRIAKEFGTARPSLAIGGDNMDAYENGASSLYAVNILNHLAGSIGIKGGLIPNPEGVLKGEKRYGKGIGTLLGAAAAGHAGALIVYNANPVFTAPKAAKAAEALRKIPFIASLSGFMDETTAMADLILPAHHPLEDWGDDFNEPSIGYQVATVRQPAVSPFVNTMPLGDIILAAGKGAGGRLKDKMPWDSFGDFLKDSWKGIYG